MICPFHQSLVKANDIVAHCECRISISAVTSPLFKMEGLPPGQLFIVEYTFPKHLSKAHQEDSRNSQKYHVT